jgi:hypothetical protein
MYVPTWIKVVWAWNWFHFNKVDKMATPKFQISFPKNHWKLYEAIMQGSLASWKKQAIQNGGSLLPSIAPGPEDGTVSSPGAPIAWRLRPMAAMVCKMGRFTFLWKKVSLITCKYGYILWD